MYKGQLTHKHIKALANNTIELDLTGRFVYFKTTKLVARRTRRQANPYLLPYKLYEITGYYEASIKNILVYIKPDTKLDSIGATKPLISLYTSCQHLNDYGWDMHWVLAKYNPKHKHGDVLKKWKD